MEKKAKNQQNEAKHWNCQICIVQGSKLLNTLNCTQKINSKQFEPLSNEIYIKTDVLEQNKIILFVSETYNRQKGELEI